MRNDERSPRRHALERCAVALWLAAIAALLYATLTAQLARAAEVPADVGAGTLLLESADGFDQAAPLSTDVRISVTGIVARIAISQRFRNTGADWIEGVYVLPLPDDAAVDTLTLRVGDRIVEGEIHEREEAARIYREARESGRRASIVSQTTPNLFSTAVANIGPGEWLDITIEYLQTARYDAGEWSLRLPLTLTPRYGASGADGQGAGPPREQSGSRGAETAPTGEARSESERPPCRDCDAGLPPRNEARIEAVLTPGFTLAEVGARSHDVEVVRNGARFTIRTAAPRVAMDRDFVLAWRPSLGATPTLAALAETRGDTTYALLMLLPPADRHGHRTQPREMIYVIDTSGSMSGQPLDQAKAALASALGRLTGADRFNIVQFNSTTSALYENPAPLTAASFAEALRYVERLAAEGGTEMEPAIRAALGQSNAGGFLRQVIFLTDGGVADETGLFAAIKQDLGDARLFTIGIGAAPNAYFMRKAAQFGRGTYTHVGSTEAVEGSMDSLLAKLEQVALADVLVDWPDALELYPHRLPDLYAGEPLVVAASYPAAGEAARVTASGSASGALWSASVGVVAADSPGIAALWARRKIEFLIDSRVDGVREELIRKMVVDTALEHGLVSPYTSLVAVDKTPTRSAAAALTRRAVTNMAPAGGTYATLPQTASGAPFHRLLGLLLLAAAAALLVGRRRTA